MSFGGSGFGGSGFSGSGFGGKYSGGGSGNLGRYGGYENRRPSGIPSRPAERPKPGPRPLASPAPRPSGIPSSRPVAPSPDFTPSPVSELRAGQRIEHNRFGAGTIKQLTGAAPDVKAVIVFDTFGEKILLLKYAKVRIL